MSEARQTVTIAVDAQDLPGTQAVIGQGLRREITDAGMLGVANNTGILELLVSGHPAVRLHIFEDRTGQAVVEVTDILARKVLGRVDIELYGLVPPRRTPAPKKDRRFGDD